jgi:hypothetical protein
MSEHQPLATLEANLKTLSELVARLKFLNKELRYTLKV